MPMLSRSACTPVRQRGRDGGERDVGRRAQWRDRRRTVPSAWKRARRYAAWASRPAAQDRPPAPQVGARAEQVVLLDEGPQRLAVEADPADVEPRGARLHGADVVVHAVRRRARTRSTTKSSSSLSIVMNSTVRLWLVPCPYWPTKPSAWSQPTRAASSTSVCTSPRCTSVRVDRRSRCPAPARRPAARRPRRWRWRTDQVIAGGLDRSPVAELDAEDRLLAVVLDRHHPRRCRRPSSRPS